MALIILNQPWGGQSHGYLLSVLKKYSQNPDQIRLIPQRGIAFMRVYGAEVEEDIFRLRDPEIESGGRRINRPLRTWTRNESLIIGFETIKHAETEAEYYS